MRAQSIIHADPKIKRDNHEEGGVLIVLILQCDVARGCQDVVEKVLFKLIFLGENGCH